MHFGPIEQHVLRVQGTGYGLIVGFGAFFSLLTIGLVYADYRARGGGSCMHRTASPHACMNIRRLLLSFARLKPVLAAAGGRHYNSEDFNTAGRTIKTGLIAVDVVAHCEI